jgi:U3 small nucleolar RNA-associated protein 24
MISKENVEKAAKKAEADKVAEEKRAMCVSCVYRNPFLTNLQCTGAGVVSWRQRSRETVAHIRLFLSHNTNLGPPYRVLVDTNFINFSIQNKIELVQGMMDCLMAKCRSQVLCGTD